MCLHYTSHSSSLSMHDREASSPNSLVAYAGAGQVRNSVRLGVWSAGRMRSISDQILPDLAKLGPDSDRSRANSSGFLAELSQIVFEIFPRPNTAHVWSPVAEPRQALSEPDSSAVSAALARPSMVAQRPTFWQAPLDA